MEPINGDANENLKSILIQIRNCLIERKEVWSIEDLSNFTGFSKNYIYGLTARKVIPYYKCPGGGKTTFKRQEVLDWLISNQVPVKKTGKSNIEFEIQALNRIFSHAFKKSI